MSRRAPDGRARDSRAKAGRAPDAGHGSQVEASGERLDGGSRASVPDEHAVRELAARRGEPVVTSLYLNVDGRVYPRPSDYAPNVDRLVRLARERARAAGEEAARATEADLGRIGDWLHAGLDRRTTRGLALFSCERPLWFEAFSLPVAVEDEVVVEPCADVAPLCQIVASSERVLVVAVDKVRSRILRLESGKVDEVDAPFGAAERQVDTDVELGSFERRAQDHARRHYRIVVQALSRQLEEWPAQRIVLCGPYDDVARTQALMPERLVSLVAGRISLPLAAGRDELAAAATEVTAAAKRHEQQALVDELRGRAEQGAGAVKGLEATLDALGAGRATVLVVEAGFAEAGARCPACALLTIGGTRCPRCGAPLLPTENVAGAAITEAFVHHVALEVCEPEDVVDLGHIAALERG